MSEEKCCFYNICNGIEESEESPCHYCRNGQFDDLEVCGYCNGCDSCKFELITKEEMEKW